MKHLLFIPIVACLVMTCIIGHASGTISDGSIEEWLAQYGLLEGNSLIIEWQERCTTQDDVYVHGCRLETHRGGVFRDVYFTTEGVLLEDEELEALGIVQKKWEEMDASFSSHWVSGNARGKAGTMPVKRYPGVPACTLAPIDHDALLAADAERESHEGSSLIRYGVNRDMAPPVAFYGGDYNAGVFHENENGSWQWELDIEAPGALAMRIGFDALSLPDDVELYVYNPQDRTEYYGPFRSGEFVWSPSIMSDTTGIVCSGTSWQSLSSVNLTIPRIIHVYRSPLIEEKALGTCHVDIACRPEWEGHATAVGRLGLVDFDAWACTGALIVAPGYSDNPPFLLTANHCISLQAQATTLEIWWLYQRTACDDELPPDMTSVPRSTGGATLLAGSSAVSGSDFALLLLNEPVPIAAAFLGYTTRPVAIDESVVCIHHPQGMEKKISFGSTSDAGSPRLSGQPLTPYEYFHEVLWTEGTTEGGSSGSPLILMDSGQIIGQLYGGYASCTAVDEPDYFGRMDVSYPLIEPWLDGSYPIEGESEEGEAEGEAEGEGETEGEVVEGESEGEQEGEIVEEGEDERCLFGLVRCPATEQGARLLQYLEVAVQALLSFLGIWLLRAIIFRNGL